MLLITPRKPKSSWSKLNKERAARMEREGRMTDAGRAVIDAAKASGTWVALDRVEALEVPEDLAEALRASRGGKAAAHFDAFPRSAKRAILEWIGAAKTPETRARRVAETATKAAKNERANQWRK